MKRTTILPILSILLLIFANSALAQDFGPGGSAGNGVCQFVDEDGDGFNDLAPDADGDGIPNGLDPDYVKPLDGTGNQFKWARAYGELFRKFFGEDFTMASKSGEQGHWGPGDGTGECIGDGTTGGAFGPGAGDGTGTGGGAGGSGGSDTGSGVQGRHGGRG